MARFKAQRTQRTFTDATVYDRLIPEDHLLVRLNQILDWSFIEETCRPYYQDRGRQGENPVVLFKMLFLAYLYNFSERRIEEECTFNLLFKYFLNLEVEERPPDHSTLARFRDRLGEKGFREIFNRLVEAARSAGLVSDQLRLVDATHQVANVDVPQSNLRQPRDPNDKDKTHLPGSPDPDARFGHKTDSKKFYGYKHHIGADADSGLVVAQATSGGNRNDDEYLLAMAAGPPPQELTADKMYDQPVYHRRLEAQGTRSFIIRKKNSPLPQDPRYYKVIRRRRWVERIFAVQKNQHGGGRARYWGLIRVSAQNLLLDTTYNLKLLVDILWPQRRRLCPQYC